MEKLFRDLTSGMLRRKRGADFDLSDSDDGGEARRRMKRRQFVKMQRALFTDERISKVAENPRNQAFLRTIEDHASDDDTDFLFEAPPGPTEASQATSQEILVPNSQPEAGPDRAQSRSQPRPAAPRRRRAGKKPSSLSEIRDSLSSLLEEPDASVIPATDPSLHSDADEEDDQPRNSRSPSSSNKENRNPRRGRHVDVVDRLSLQRAGSSNLSTSARMAFAAPSATGAGFKVPALLRRATTNSLVSISSSTSSGSGGGAAAAASTRSGFSNEAKIKKGASKKSGVNYFARENERRTAIAENEKRREARKLKGAEGRSRVVEGLFGAGKFE